MSTPTSATKPLWTQTPLKYAHQISQTIGARAYLKLENLHPSHSFKYRGISHFISTHHARLSLTGTNPHDLHCVIASGGNAGLAAACAARQLHCLCTVFIPEGVSQSTLDLLKSEGAEAVVGGKVYADAVKKAKEMVEEDPNAVMVPAYEDPLIWEGHSSMITEAHSQMPNKPSAIFCSVGGGGLLGGILQGCRAVGWEDVPIIALETNGCDCFYHSMSLNVPRFNSTSRTLPLGMSVVHEEKDDLYLAHLPKFTSRAAGSLGASQPAEAVVRMALDWPGGVRCVSVPDGMSMEGLVSFANDQKMLVELACSTTLVPAYNRALFDKLMEPSPSLTQGPAAPGTKGDGERSVLFIVCGGFKVSLSEANEYQEMLNETPRGPGETWSVKMDDGSLFTFPKNPSGSS